MDARVDVERGSEEEKMIATPAAHRELSADDVNREGRSPFADEYHPDEEEATKCIIGWNEEDKDEEIDMDIEVAEPFARQAHDRCLANYVMRMLDVVASSEHK